MACVLGINAVFHDPAAAIIVDGTLVAAAEEERFSHRLNGKSPLPFATWELPGAAVDFCLSRAGRGMADVDAVAYSYDPQLAPPPAMNAPVSDARLAGADRYRLSYVTAWSVGAYGVYAEDSEVGRRLLSGGGAVHVAGRLRPDDWQGREGVELEIEDVADPRRSA